MNISKNILSLGLIAVISGISTAQTYTATAGTNGVTDIQSDYSMSTGDGASVSVDVPLEFELPKKVAIALKDSSGSMTSNNLFAPVASTIPPGIDSFAFNGNPYSSGSNSSSQNFQIKGAIYTNTDNIQISCTGGGVFTHESDPSSQINGMGNCVHSQLFGGQYGTNSGLYNITSRALNLTDFDNNLATFWINNHLVLDSIDPTDRAGKYTSTNTLTVSIL